MLTRGIVERIRLTDSFIRHTIGDHEIQNTFSCTDYKVAIKRILNLLVSPSEGILENIN